jgi:3D (Asp-Asp-Asp) domain-containing protein
MSRDMLEHIPYGSLVRLKDLGGYRNGRGEGKYQDLLDSQGYFIVEDTMHPRKLEQIDVWFADHSEALSWGVRKVELEVVRLGRDGPMLDQTIVAAQ